MDDVAVFYLKKIPIKKILKVSQTFLKLPCLKKKKKIFPYIINIRHYSNILFNKGERSENFFPFFLFGDLLMHISYFPKILIFFFY